MQIVTHIGAQCTDGDLLLKSLLRSSDALYERRVAVPGHGRYRKLLRETIQALQGGAPAPGTRDVMLDEILGDREADRLVFSNPAFICVPSRAFEGGQLYGLAGQRLQAMRLLFPGDTHEIFLAIRNPATFIPAMYEKVENREVADWLSGLDPREVRWSDMVERIRQAVPDARLTVWCNEDIPLIWGEILRAVAGPAAPVRMEGEFDVLASIMSPEGMSRFLAYLRSHPPQTGAQTRRVIAAFLDKYALPGEIVEEVSLPGWDDALVEDMTAAYEADAEALSRRGDITFLAP